MRPEALDEEVHALADYGHLLKSWRRESAEKVTIVTQEGETLHTVIGNDGWAIEADHVHSERVFPTLEALLLTASPKFASGWDQELSDKLQKVRDAEDAED